jgi:hypothetical protein
VAETELKVRGEKLHKLMVHEDVTAPALIATEILPQVMSDLKRRKPARRCDDDVLSDAICDAFLEYKDKPKRYDPIKLSLVAYLGLAAYRNLLNAKRDARTRLKYENSVELPRVAGKIIVETSDQAEEQERLLSLIPGKTMEEKIAGLLPDLMDQRICLLMLQGERSTVVFAKAVGMAESKDARQEIKRRKDRIKKVLERTRARLTDGQ